MILMIMIPLLALPPARVYHITMHEPGSSPLNSNVLASPVKELDSYSNAGSFGFDADGIIGENTSDAIYPAFNFSLTETDRPQNKDLTISSSFLPVPDLMSETGTPAQGASTAEDASEMTQSAIEKMVNPSSLLSSAMDDIRQSGVSNTDASPQAQTALNKTISVLNTEFSTIHLYGTDIPPKDYLVVSSDEESGDDKSKIFATARIPCNDKHETPLRVVLMENWSSIAYPPPKMHLIEGVPDGELCMFRIEHPDKEIVDSYITPNIADKSSIHDLVETTAIALYNSGATAIKFPKASSITISHLSSP
ncbi:MAG: hypothetical protein ACRD8W_08165, partial [Nitrososphaeraceae archaeon]